MHKSVFASYAGGCKLRFICGKAFNPHKANQVGGMLKQKGRTKLFGLFLLHTDTQGRTAMRANESCTLFVRFVLKKFGYIAPYHVCNFA